VTKELASPLDFWAFEDQCRFYLPITPTKADFETSSGFDFIFAIHKSCG
jgi:hypothetical protein